MSSCLGSSHRRVVRESLRNSLIWSLQRRHDQTEFQWTEIRYYFIFSFVLICSQRGRSTIINVTCQVVDYPNLNLLVPFFSNLYTSPWHRKSHLTDWLAKEWWRYLDISYFIFSKAPLARLGSDRFLSLQWTEILQNVRHRSIIKIQWSYQEARYSNHNIVVGCRFNFLIRYIKLNGSLQYAFTTYTWRLFNWSSKTSASPWSVVT